MAFKQEDETNKDKQSEDNFGLPDLDYKPLDRLDDKPATESINETPVEEEVLSEQTTSSETEYKPEERSVYTPVEEEKSKAPIIIGVIIFLILALAGFLIYQYVIKPNAEKEKQEQIAKEKLRKEQEEAARLAKQREEEERQRLAAEAAAKAKPAEGAIESLTASTGRYYVVVASAVDADLVMDYAKKLSAKGVGTKIIPPFGKSKFNRMAISDFDTYAAAQSAADASKAEYGNEVWVIRY